jgi:hypothetical protein
VGSPHAFAQLEALNCDVVDAFSQVFGVAPPTCREEMETLMDAKRVELADAFEDFFVSFFSLYWTTCSCYSVNFVPFTSTVADCAWEISIRNEEGMRVDQYTDNEVFSYSRFGIAAFTGQAQTEDRSMEFCVMNRSGDDEFCIPLSFKPLFE